MSTSTPARATARPNLKNTFVRAIGEFIDDGGPDLAASLTYFAVLSMFPALLAFTSLLGVLGDPQTTTDALLGIAADLGVPNDALGPVGEFLRSVQTTGGAGLALVVGLATALFSASNYVNAFTRAMNAVYEVEEGRPIWKLRPWTYLITLVMLVMVVLVAVALVLSGGVAEAIGNAVGLGPTAVTVWSIAKWPVVVVIVMMIVALLYWATPNVRPKFRILSPGAAFAIVVWALATVLFGLYVSSDLSTYNATYGAIAGVILLLLWLWITNIVLILGAEVDVELQRSRELQSGLPAEERIQLPLRDASGVAKKAAKQQEGVEARRRIRMDASLGREQD